MHIILFLTNIIKLLVIFRSLLLYHELSYIRDRVLISEKLYYRVFRSWSKIVKYITPITAATHLIIALMNRGAFALMITSYRCS